MKSIYYFTILLSVFLSAQSYSQEAMDIKAVSRYLKARDTATVIKAAQAYETKGDLGMAIDLYSRCAMFNKAGDLAWSMKLYPKAYKAYSAGKNIEAMRKCADKFYLLGVTGEASKIYMKIAGIYQKKGDTEPLEKMGSDFAKWMNYGLASMICNLTGNKVLAERYHAYDKFMSLDLDSAGILFHQNGMDSLSKAMDADMKNLLPLRDAKAQFDDWAKGQPTVGLVWDQETKQVKPNPKDEQVLVDFYKPIKDKIESLIQVISRNVQAIKDPYLKKMIIKTFLEYPAVGKELDKGTFAYIRYRCCVVKEVYLKHL